MSGAPSPRAERPSLKLVLDLGPLLLFFLVNAVWGIFAATAAFLAAVAAALAVSRLIFGAFPVMPLVTALFVIVFGTLTLYLQDETFIKVKPTLVYVLFAGLLAGGMVLGRPVLKLLMGEMLDLTDEGWRKLTYRWAAFFLLLALANEAVWRSVSTDAWVTFKVFGLVPLTILFAVLQVGLLQRHARQDE